ncbi:MAG TPA: anhydro-N-acetylmuramic acid kinase, partial [Marinobacter sp.]|nr:anhydro-N-acetylmuramic acid kinase [Marinobacter sp.]
LNPILMRELARALSPAVVCSTEELGLDPQWVEPVGFAWLARRTFLGLSGNLPGVTGASGPRILGAIYPV